MILIWSMILETVCFGKEVEKMKVTNVELKIVFSIWEDEVSVDEVPMIVTDAVDHAGYGLKDIEVVKVVETEEEV